jgi:hypothetical protein
MYPQLQCMDNGRRDIRVLALHGTLLEARGKVPNIP